MDSKLIGQGKKVEWDDWIGRFIGYLGEYEYIHGKETVGVDYVWNRENKADNIVYIYGAAKGGKKEYMTYLSGELNRRADCICYGHAFQQTGDGIANLQFQNMLVETFSAGKEDFYFPCLRLLTEAEHHTSQNGWKAALCEILDISENMTDGVEKLITGNVFQQVLGFKQVANEIFRSKNFVKAMASEERSVLANLKAELKKISASGSVGTLISEENPFDCLRLDLHINARRIKPRIICMIDGFELSRRCLAGEKDREYFLKMMASVPEIVWVLFSRKTPDDAVRAVIKRENCWRMGGISKERVMGYLEEMCPDAQKNWYSAVYRHTGGHIGLLELCVKAYNTPGKHFVSSQRVRFEKKLREAMEDGDDELIEIYQRRLERLRASEGDGTLEAGSVNADEKLKKMEQQHLDKWFRQVWNDGPWEDDFPDEDEEREEPLDFLFGSGRKDFDREPSDSEKKFFLPCLCYLVKQSMTDVGTIEQYCWSRTAPSIKLTSLGNRCVRIIEEEPSFCKEYEEYPDILYLDPVIVGVVSKHKHFEMWCRVFEEQCVIALEDVTPDKEVKRSVGSNNMTLEDAKELQNVKGSENAIVERNTGLVQDGPVTEKAFVAKEVYEVPEEGKEQREENARGGADSGNQPPQEENKLYGRYNLGNEKSEPMQTDAKAEHDKKQVEMLSQGQDDKVIVRADDENNHHLQG